jgi:hypothetical protein
MLLDLNYCLTLKENYYALRKKEKKTQDLYTQEKEKTKKKQTQEEVV